MVILNACYYIQKYPLDIVKKLEKSVMDISDAKPSLIFYLDKGKSRYHLFIL